jgi:hypothetical protein
MVMPEVVEYPDSGKFGLMSRQTTADGSPRLVRHVSRADAGADYWEGE